MDHKLTFFQKLRAYRLMNSVYVLVLLVISTGAFLWLYLSPYTDDSRILGDIALAFATSLLASIFCLVSDIYTKYKEYKNDQFLGDMQSFGIKGLHFNKQRLLEELLEDCDKEVWITGYRLIITGKIIPQIEQAIRQGANIKVLVCPPWKEGFRLMYGSDKVMDNYVKVFSCIVKAAKRYRRECEIRFTETPLLNDTYKVDSHLVTGPYMHNADREHGKITANDFFTYDLIKRSRLYKLVEEEYLSLWNAAGDYLDFDEFEVVLEQIQDGDLRDSEKMKLIMEVCHPRIETPVAS